MSHHLFILHAVEDLSDFNAKEIFDKNENPENPIKRRH